MIHILEHKKTPQGHVDKVKNVIFIWGDDRLLSVSEMFSSNHVLTQIISQQIKDRCCLQLTSPSLLLFDPSFSYISESPLLFLDNV